MRNVDTGPRAFPILEAFSRLGISTFKGYELIDAGELKTYMIGRKRFITQRDLDAFIQRQLGRSMKETAAARAKKVASPTTASVDSRTRLRKQRLAA